MARCPVTTFRSDNYLYWYTILQPPWMNRLPVSFAGMVLFLPEHQTLNQSPLPEWCSKSLNLKPYTRLLCRNGVNYVVGSESTMVYDSLFE